MEKEVLTKGRIKADLQQVAFRNTLSCLLLFLFIGVLCLFTKNFLEKNYVFLSCISIFFGVALSIVLILNVVIIISILKVSANNNFILKSDFVIEKLYKKFGHKYATNRPYTLIFANFGRYGIQDGTYYKWSKLYSMKEREVYDSTAIKDDFYIIAIKKEVVLAYNKRYFELDE